MQAWIIWYSPEILFTIMCLMIAGGVTYLVSKIVKPKIYRFNKRSRIL